MEIETLKNLLVGEFSIRRVVLSLIFVYMCIAVFVYFWSDSIIFPGAGGSYTDNTGTIKIQTRDGLAISAVYLTNSAAEFTVLYSHGNGENLGTILPFLKEYHDKGFAVFAYDYHGYGTSAGKPSEKNTYMDVTAAFNYLTRTAGVRQDRIIVHGYSVGGGPSVYLASSEKVAALILQSSFVTAFRVVTQIPLLPFDKFNNIGRITSVSCPVLVMHGSLDTTVPYWHGKALFARANEPKTSLWLSDAGHNDILCVAPEQYWRAITNMADRLSAGLASSSKPEHQE